MNRMVINRAVIGGVSVFCTFVGYTNINKSRYLASCGPDTVQTRFTNSNTTTRRQQQELLEAAPPNYDAVNTPFDMELVNVQIFFRHGARTPLSLRFLKGVDEPIYDKRFLSAHVPHTEVPYQVISYDGGPRPYSRFDERQTKEFFKGGMAHGQLTTVGRDQVYLLGQRLRKRYVEDLQFVNSVFSTDEIYVRSTNVKRCIESLQCAVAGMFGIQQFEKHGRLIIPVKTMADEDLYPNTYACCTLRQVHSLNPDLLMKLPSYSAVVAKIQSKTGNPTNTFCELMMIRDHLMARKVHGLDVPSWLLDMELEIVGASLVGLEYFTCGDPVNKKAMLSLACGRTYGMIEENMKAAMTDKDSIQKLHLYSCHDTSIYPLLTALDFPFVDWPQYAADVRFELYKDRKNQHWVKVLFCSQEYVLPGCTEPLISFSMFQEIIESVIITPDEWKLGCNDVNTAKELASKRESAQR